MRLFEYQMINMEQSGVYPTCPGKLLLAPCNAPTIGISCLPRLTLSNVLFWQQYILCHYALHEGAFTFPRLRKVLPCFPLTVHSVSGPGTIKHALTPLTLLREVCMLDLIAFLPPFLLGGAQGMVVGDLKRGVRAATLRASRRDRPRDAHELSSLCSTRRSLHFSEVDLLPDSQPRDLLDARRRARL